MRQLTFGTLSGLDLFQPPLSRLGYLHSPGTGDEIKPITHWIIGDLATKVRRVGLQRCSQSCCPRTPSAQLCMMQGVRHAELHCAAPGITADTEQPCCQFATGSPGLVRQFSSLSSSNSLALLM